MMARMLRLPLVALLSLLSFSAFAQADLSAELLSAPDTARPGETWTTRGRITNLGPGTALQVTVTVSAGLNQCETKIEELAEGESREYSCSGEFPVGQPVYLLAAAVNVYTIYGDPIYMNNLSFKLVRAITPPDLWTGGYAVAVAQPGLPVPVRVQYDNRAQTPSTNTIVTIDAPNGFGALPDFCSASGNRAVCNLGTLEPPKDLGYTTPDQFEIEVIAPDVSATKFNLALTIDASEEDARPADDKYLVPLSTYRTFDVSTLDDHGSGSLRAAMEAANAECTDATPCLIAFRIPAGARTWQTISLESPLPRLVNPAFIDGTTQTGYFGDTNPDGPEIEISGADLHEGNGLEIQCDGLVRGLAINNFPDNGIAVVGSSTCTRPILGYPLLRGIRDSYIGVDPTGTRAMPNTRGVRIDVAGWGVDGNIISGNKRAGVFVTSGVVAITHNRIGLSRDNQPLGNGAAGVFIGAAASGSDVSNNYIGFNHEFGIAIAGDAQYVSANKNSLQGNFQQGIDWGLDGTVATTRVPLPIITSVRFEDGVTIVEGTTTAYGTFQPAISVYANDAPDPSGYGEGQYVLGEVRADPGQPMPWRFVYGGDLRGKWITATATHQYYTGWLRKPGSNGDTGWGYYTTTSEFSRAFAFK